MTLIAPAKGLTAADKRGESGRRSTGLKTNNEARLPRGEDNEQGMRGPRGDVAGGAVAGAHRDGAAGLRDAELRRPIRRQFERLSGISALETELVS